jgi:copper homeostasis protein
MGKRKGLKQGIMTQNIILEICANSLTSALEAQSGGADRIELCESLELGGVTPSPGTLRLCREKLSIPIHVLVRPRGGDFLYSDEEYDVMKEDVLYCKSIGINGIVTGILHPDGRIDKARCAELKALAEPMNISFHRAFDFCRDPFEALEDLISLGFERILTAGQQNTVPQGLALIKTLVGRANGRIIIMPGSGVDENNIREILAQSGATEIHTTAKISTDGPMQYRKDTVGLSISLDESGYGRVGTYRRRVQELCTIIGK